MQQAAQRVLSIVPRTLNSNLISRSRSSGSYCQYKATRNLLSVLQSHTRNMSGPVSSAAFPLVEYSPPEWAKKLRNVPTHRVQLGHLNTPIHRWQLPGVPDGFEVYIKRDDMTGSTLSGNKVRKLEFILAAAVHRGCRHIITCGGIQSNHCRATAIAAAQMGLKCHLILRAGIHSGREAGCQGNVLLDRLSGAKLYFTPAVAPHGTELVPRMEKLAQTIKADTGEDSYVMPVGGSDDVGFYGYLEAFNELQQQGALQRFSDVVFASGSGGTVEGLAAANWLTGSQLRIHAVAVSDHARSFQDHANIIYEQVGLTGALAEDLFEVVEGYKGKGYGVSTQEELDFVVSVAQETGIVLDPVYTGKGTRGMLGELKNNPTRFQGNRILYIHTGGLLGAYAGRLNGTLENDVSQCYVWDSLQHDPVQV